MTPFQTKIWQFVRYAFAAAVALIVVVLGLYAVLPESTVNSWAGHFLITADPLEPSSIVYLLGGDYLTRAPHAAALYHRGLAPRIVIPREHMDLGNNPDRQHFTDATRDILLREKVPESAIFEWRLDRGVRNTADEAAALAKYVEVFHPQRVIVVTSAFHTRRAGYVCRRALWFSGAEVRMAPVENPAYGPDTWWFTPAGKTAFQDEAIKLPYYWIRYFLGV